VNTLGYPFEQSGYRIATFQSLYFGPFLSYKIEGSSAAFFPRDIEMSLNAVHDKILPLHSLRVRIDERTNSGIFKLRSLASCGSRAQTLWRAKSFRSSSPKRSLPTTFTI
jgi:hypothetical protein